MVLVLCLHGLGGSAATMAPIAAGLAAAGHEVISPTLPGHGGRPEDLLDVTWADWLSAAEASRAAIVIGQSMGAGLALDLGARGLCRAIVAINPLAPDPDALEGLQWRRQRGVEWVEVAPSTVGEDACDRLPISALIAMTEGIASIVMHKVSCPVLIVTSEHDDIVDPANSDVIATLVSGPVERLRLAASGHVASLDVERAAVVTATLEFMTRTSQL